MASAPRPSGELAEEGYGHRLDSCAATTYRRRDPMATARPRALAARVTRPGAPRSRTCATAAALERRSRPRGRPLGRLDAVVAAAAVIAGGLRCGRRPTSDLRPLWDVDVRGVWNTAAAAVPAMLAGAGPARLPVRGGRVGRRRPTGCSSLAAYTVAKHAVVGLVKGLAADLVGTGVTAVAVSPGSTRTPMLEATARPLRLPDTEDFASHQLLRRLLEPEEIAATIAFCCSARGRRSTARVVHADGGFRRMTARLPARLPGRLARDVRTRDGGRLLVGGSPLRVAAADRPRTTCSSDGQSSSSTGHRRARRPAARGQPRRPGARRPAPPPRRAHRGRPGPRPARPARPRCWPRWRPLPVHRGRRRVARRPEPRRRGRGRHGADSCRLDHNVGPAGARNAGLAASRRRTSRSSTPTSWSPRPDLRAAAPALRRPAGRGRSGRGCGRASRHRLRWFERYDAAVLVPRPRHAPALRAARGRRSRWLPSACLLVARVACSGGAGSTSCMRVGEDVDLVWRLDPRGGTGSATSRAVRGPPRQPGDLAEWLGRKSSTAPAERGWPAARRLAGAAVLSPVPALGVVALLGQRRWSVPIAACCGLRIAATLARSCPRPRPRPACGSRSTGQGLVVDRR